MGMGCSVNIIILYHEEQASHVKSLAFGSFLSKDMKVKFSF